MGITAHRTVWRDNLRPGLTKVGCLVDIWPHVAKRVQVERCVGRALIEMARIDRCHPGVLRQAFDISNDVLPGFAAITSHLHVAVVGADPD